MSNNKWHNNNKRQNYQQNNTYQVQNIDKIDSFWKDKANKIPREDLFSDLAAKIALQTNQNGAGKNNKPTQIRKFYDEILKFKKDLLLDKTLFDKKLPYIKMINAKFAYSCARKHITKECKEFFIDCINKIKDYDDFILFSDFFEAFIAFYRQYDK